MNSDQRFELSATLFGADEDARFCCKSVKNNVDASVVVNPAGAILNIHMDGDDDDATKWMPVVLTVLLTNHELVMNEKMIIYIRGCCHPPATLKQRRM